MKQTFLLFFTLCYLLNFSQETKKKGSFSGNFDLGLNFTKNTESTYQFNNVFLVNYKKEASNISFKSNIAFLSKTGEDDLLNKGVQDLKYSYQKYKVDANLTFQNLYDVSMSIKNRFTSGIGVNYSLKDNDNKKIGFGLSTLREKETTLEGEHKLQTRMSGNFELIIKLNNNISISNITNYQPSIETIGDFRWKTNMDIRIHLSNTFLLMITTTYNYDSMPARNLPKSDYQLINSISYTF